MSSNIPLRDLLAELDWMRTLAVQLVGADADDLTQDVVRDVLRRGPSERGRLRGFLATALRRRAANRRRDDYRRWRRESIAARRRPEGVDPGDAVAELELQQAIAAAVVELPEPYRETLVLRYYRDLSIAEVASQLDIPEATVRTRTHRAVEKLRNALDARFGDRETWRPAALGLAAAGSGSGAVGAAGSTKAGLLTALSLSVALIVAWSISAGPFGGREGEAVSMSTRVPVGTSSLRSNDEGRELESSPVEPDLRSASPIASASLLPGESANREAGESTTEDPSSIDETHSLVVRVFEPGRTRPAAGITVRVSRPSDSAGKRIELDEDEKPRLTTDAKGRARFELPREWNSVFIKSESSEWFPPTAEKKVELADSSGTEQELELSTGGTFSGRVVTEEGRAVPGATVGIFFGHRYQPRPSGPDRELVTDASGRFRSRGVGGSFFAEAWVDGRYAPSRGLLGTLEDEQIASDLELVVAEQNDQQVQVVDKEGVSIPGVTIDVRSERFSPSEWKPTDVRGIQSYEAGETSAVADDQGRAVLIGLPLRSSYGSWLETPEPKVAALPAIRHSPTVSTVEIDLGEPLEVIVIDADTKAPIEGAEVHANAVGRRHVTTNPDGRATIPRMRPLRILGARIVALAEGYGAEVETWVESNGEPVEFRLRPEMLLAGRIVADGAPVSEATVFVQQLGSGTSRHNYSTTVHGRVYRASMDSAEAMLRRYRVDVDSEGRFSFENLRPGSTELHVYAPDRSVVVRAFSETDEEIEIDLPPREQTLVRGHLRSSGAGAIRNGTIMAWSGEREPRNGTGSPVGEVRADGWFEIELDSEVDWVTFSADRHADEEIDAETLRTTDSATVTLHPARSLRVVRPAVTWRVGSSERPVVIQRWRIEDQDGGVRAPMESGINARELTHGLPAIPLVVVGWTRDDERFEFPIDLSKTASDAIPQIVLDPSKDN